MRIAKRVKLTLIVFLFLLFTSSLALAAGTNTARHQKNEMKDTGLFDDKDGNSWPNIFDFDADGDGLPFWREGFFWRDSDRDGVKDYLDRDSDNDTVDDCTESKLGFNPTDTDTDDDGVNDSEEDRDKDGLADFIEVKINTKFNDPDTDDDGVLDGEEAKVVLFSGWGYYGESISLDGDISDLGDFKNNVGSLKIAKGYSAILFDKKDFKGQSVVLSNQVPESLRKDLWYIDFWRKAESVKIITDWPATVVYEDINYGGKSKIIKGWNTEFVGNDFNDIISSMVIPPNYGLIAYEHRSYRGRVRGFYRKRSGGISWVGSDFNDLISSLDLYPPPPLSFSRLGIAKKTMEIEETLVRDGTKAEGKFPGVDSNGRKLRKVPVVNIRGARCIAWLYFKPDKKRGDFKRGDFINVIFLGNTARGVNDFLQSLRKEKNKKVWKHWSEDNYGTSLWVAYNLIPASGGAKMKVTNCRAQEFTLRSGSYRGWSTHIRIYGIGYNVVVGGVHREHWNWKNSQHEEIDYNEGAMDTYSLLSKYGSGKYKNIYLIETKGYLESGAKYVVVVEF